MKSIRVEIILSLLTCFAAVAANMLVPLDDNEKSLASGYVGYPYPSPYPFVSFIKRSDPEPYPKPTNASSVDFTVGFTEPVKGVDKIDFAFTTTGSITGYSVTGVLPATGLSDRYTVRVSTGQYNGTLRLNLLDNDSIKDRENNPLGGPGKRNGDFNSGQAYTIFKTYRSNMKSIAIHDGWTLESSEISNQGGTMESAATTFYLGDHAQKKQFRAILSFSTKTLPDKAVITKIILKVKKQGLAGGGNPVNIFQGFLVDVKKGFFGSVAGLQVSDFQAGADKSYGPYKPTLVNGWYAINLTPAKPYINKLATNSGVTQVRLRFKLDDNNNAVANYLKLYSGDAPIASRPQLIIEYYVP